jgi:hypothetical protein
MWRKAGRNRWVSIIESVAHAEELWAEGRSSQLRGMNTRELLCGGKFDKDGCWVKINDISSSHSRLSAFMRRDVRGEGRGLFPPLVSKSILPSF